VVIEAWVEGIPVLVNGACGPTREHCERSGGGLWFTSYQEFEAVLDRLVSDAGLRAELGGRGRDFVDHHFRWPVLVDRYDRFLTSVVERGRGAASLF
jgi:glycosyltransferase involved in cell wall biosynthesis